MNSKRLFQIFVLFILLFAPLGANQPVRASTNAVDKPEIQSIDRHVHGLQDQPIVSMIVTPTSMNVGEMATVTVSLNHVPVEGYTSAELNCTYDPNVAEASNIVIGNLFGIDPVTAISGPHNGQFIVAIAGSDGKKAMSDGVVFAFNVRGLQAGHSSLECQARVSTGDNVLTNIGSTIGNVIILGATATPTFIPTPCDKAEFIADVNVPPGTVMSPGAQFTKTWRLKNVGTCTWTLSYRMAFLSGDQMSAPSSIQIPVNVAPGQMVDLSLNMAAPSVTGSYRGYWIFQNSTGQPFGIGSQGNEPWFVDIVVSTASVTPTFTQPPASFTPTSTPGGPTDSPTPSITPGGPTVTPVPGVVYDFVANACSATWSSGAGGLLCPGVDGDPKGFVLRLNNPTLETGITDTRPGLLTVPQNVQNGYIQGFYPQFRVQNGDHFRSTIGCESGAINCYLAFRLDYQVGSDPIKTFWGPFLERYDGHTFSVDVDLSRLADQDVRFILTVLSSGQPSEDRAMWVGPIISRANVSPTPTSDVSQTPTATPSEPPISTFTPTPTESSTPTSTPSGAGLLTGRVFASKLVTINVYDSEDNLVGAASLNPDGTFDLNASIGTNIVIASAIGFLSSQRSVTITEGSSITLPTIMLIAGDIDGDNVIDQFDAMTIGMSYNASTPSAADLNNDGIINVLDLELLARNYRKTGPVTWE